MPTPTRTIRGRKALGMTTMMLWKEGWSSEEEDRPSGVEQLSHMMKHVEQKRIRGWHSMMQRSGTERKREGLRARRANSKETGGRRAWDEGLCVRNPWVDQERDGRTRGTGAVGKKTRWTRLGWGMKRKGQ